VLPPLALCVALEEWDLSAPRVPPIKILVSFSNGGGDPYALLATTRSERIAIRPCRPINVSISVPGLLGSLHCSWPCFPNRLAPAAASTALRTRTGSSVPGRIIIA
jgi:hypothetical protein